MQENSRFARKNYFYPDLPKGYQISMYELPLAIAGWLEIDHDGARKRIGITRLHLEEDAAKNLHEGFPDSDRSSYIDYNRGGTPLAEIVSEPDLRSPTEAYAYLTALKQVLEYAEVSDCNMEEGSLRCDANVSVRRRGAERFGTKAEVKNLNSFRYLQKALEYEIERQIGVLESGGRIAQETRLWNVGEGRTDPDALEGIRARLSLLPRSRSAPGSRRSVLARRNPARRCRSCPRAAASASSAPTRFPPTMPACSRPPAPSPIISRRVVKAGAPAKPAANWIATELLRRLNDSGREIDASPVSPAALAELLRRVEAGSITGASGKKVFAAMFESGKSAEEIIAAEGLSQIQDTGEIERLCREVIEKNPDNVAKYRGGNEGVFKFFRGPGDPRFARPGQSAARQRHAEAAARLAAKAATKWRQNNDAERRRQSPGLPPEGRRRPGDCALRPARQVRGALFLSQGQYAGLHHGSAEFRDAKPQFDKAGAVVLGLQRR